MSLNSPTQRYLNDLELSTPANQSISFINDLIARHVARYPFSNLALTLGETISLELESIAEKFIDRRLGGYCFEHNKLVYSVLSDLGYSAQLKMARVLNNKPEMTPLTHRITLLNFNNEDFLIDVGFGSDEPVSALHFVTDTEQQSGSNIFKIVQIENESYQLQVLKSGNFFTLYQFNLAPYYDADCVAANFYTSSYPKSGFVNNLVISLKDSQRLISLRNHLVLIQDAEQLTETIIQSPALLKEIISENFSVTINDAQAENLFQRFLAQPLAAMETEK